MAVGHPATEVTRLATKAARRDVKVNGKPPGFPGNQSWRRGTSAD